MSDKNFVAMVEVFKTNVSNPVHAKRLVREIHALFTNYSANFDLDDCDKILRIQSEEEINSNALIEMLRLHECEARVLPDEIFIYTEYQPL